MATVVRSRVATWSRYQAGQRLGAVDVLKGNDYVRVWINRADRIPDSPPSALSGRGTRQVDVWRNTAMSRTVVVQPHVRLIVRLAMTAQARSKALSFPQRARCGFTAQQRGRSRPDFLTSLRIS